MNNATVEDFQKLSPQTIATLEMIAEYGGDAPAPEPSTSTIVQSPVATFVKFPKIPRFEKVSVLITEKLDGTNAQVIVPEDPEAPLLVGSRNRWIVPGKSTDNFGFAGWVHDNAAAIRTLGPGTHYGEWWGVGIGRGYGLTERRWSLFNTHRPLPVGLPANIGIVPVLYHRQADLFNGSWGNIPEVVRALRQNGSKAVPGYMKPEGVVLTINNQLYKVVFDKHGPSPEEAVS